MEFQKYDRLAGASVFFPLPFQGRTAPMTTLARFLGRTAPMTTLARLFEGDGRSSGRNPYQLCTRAR